MGLQHWDGDLLQSLRRFLPRAILSVLAVPLVRKRAFDGIARAKEQIAAEINDLRDSLRDAHQLMVKYRAEVTSENDDVSGPPTPAPSVSFSVS